MTFVKSPKLVSNASYYLRNESMFTNDQEKAVNH